MKSASRSYVKAEVEAMRWDEYLYDPEGDSRREINRVRALAAYWRAVALGLLTGCGCFILIELLG